MSELDEQDQDIIRKAAKLILSFVRSWEDMVRVNAALADAAYPQYKPQLYALKVVKLDGR